VPREQVRGEELTPPLPKGQMVKKAEDAEEAVNEDKVNGKEAEDRQAGDQPRQAGGRLLQEEETPGTEEWSRRTSEDVALEKKEKKKVVGKLLHMCKGAR